MSQCDFPRCHDESGYTYIGKQVCQRHWALLCQAYDEDAAKEKRLLAKIGLIRDPEARDVIPLGVYSRRLKARDHRDQGATHAEDRSQAQPEDPQEPIENAPADETGAGVCVG